MAAPSGSPLIGTSAPAKAQGGGGDRSSEAPYRDFSKVLPGPESGMALSRDSMITFPSKLHEILSRPEFAHAICWMPHGRAWRILQQKVFENQIIPLYFRHGRYSSFARQVNGWGFKRIVHGPDYNCYYHELFLRGMPHLCGKMKRLTGNGSSDEFERQRDATPPDFYAISQENPLPLSSSSLSSTLPVPPPALDPTLSQASCIQAMHLNAMIASSLYGQVASGATGNQVKPIMDLLMMANSFASLAASAATQANKQAGSQDGAAEEAPKPGSFQALLAQPQLLPNHTIKTGTPARGVVELSDNISTASLSLLGGKTGPPTISPGEAAPEANKASSFRELLKQYMDNKNGGENQTPSLTAAPSPSVPIQDLQLSVQKQQDQIPSARPAPLPAAPTPLPTPPPLDAQVLASIQQAASAKNALTQPQPPAAAGAAQKAPSPDGSSFAHLLAGDPGLLQRLMLLSSGATPGSSSGAPILTSSFEALLRQTGQLGAATPDEQEQNSLKVSAPAVPNLGVQGILPVVPTNAPSQEPAATAAGLQQLLDAVHVLKDGSGVVAPVPFHR